MTFRLSSDAPPQQSWITSSFSRGHIFDFDRIIRAVVARSLHYDANLMTVDDREEIWELMSEVHTAAHRHDSIGEKYIMQELERGAQLARAPLMTSVPCPLLLLVALSPVSFCHSSFL